MTWMIKFKVIIFNVQYMHQGVKMKVVAAVNGTITAESMAFYALRYAKAQSFTLLLLHVENKKDDLNEVKASIERITTVALSEDIQVQQSILKKSSKEEIKEFLSSSNVDTIFCSTRKHKRFITDSFSEVLINMGLNIDIAVVRIVNISIIKDFNNMVLFIKEDKLSVKKFTFFATLASAYRADTEIYSITSMSRYKLSKVGIHEARQRLESINYNLRHYLKLVNFMSFRIHIKHSFANSEAKSILTHIAKSDVQLSVVGAKRLSIKSFFSKEMPIEKLMREASINTIAYYSKDL